MYNDYIRNFMIKFCRKKHLCYVSVQLCCAYLIKLYMFSICRFFFILKLAVILFIHIHTYIHTYIYIYIYTYIYRSIYIYVCMYGLDAVVSLYEIAEVYPYMKWLLFYLKNEPNPSWHQNYLVIFTIAVKLCD